MIFDLVKLANLFYKFAVEVPEWISHQTIKQRLESVPDIIKNPKLKSFEEDVVLHKSKELLNSDKNIIERIANSLMVLSVRGYIENFKYKTAAVNLLEEYHYEPDKNNLLNHKLWRNLINNNKVQINPIIYKDNFTKREKKQFDSSFVRGSVFLKELFRTVGDYDQNKNQKEIDQNYIENLSKNINSKHKEGEFKVIFSTDYKDILGMSDRSTWKSCLTLEDCDEEKQKSFTSKYKLGLIGAAINENIGVIYVTNNLNYKNKGAEMLFRAQVWLVKNDKEEYLYLQKLYPTERQDIIDLFKNLLFKHLQIPVAELHDQDYKLPISHLSTTYEIPYSDSYNVYFETKHQKDKYKDFQDIEKNITILKDEIVEKLTKANLDKSNNVNNLINNLKNNDSEDIISSKAIRTEILHNIDEIKKDEFSINTEIKKLFPLLNNLYDEINTILYMQYGDM